ncbi:hypothetical protein TNCV_4418891 [Trichonephila clavipes]|nr:hypothetical protein TNCV_4418891 [Trichonephila clavipes]
MALLTISAVTTDIEPFIITCKQREETTLAKLESDADCCAVGPGFESRIRHDVCKCVVPLRHGGTLNSHRATCPPMRLVKGKKGTLHMRHSSDADPRPITHPASKEVSHSGCFTWCPILSLTFSRRRIDQRKTF